jgi:hypothetical protein
LQREECGSATKSGEVGNSRIEGNAAGDYAGSSRKFPEVSGIILERCAVSLEKRQKVLSYLWDVFIRI